MISRVKKRKIVKWVCNECGMNNMNHMRLCYQCTVCGKIKTIEPVSIVNIDSVIDNITDEEIHINRNNLGQISGVIITEFISKHMSKVICLVLMFSIVNEMILIYLRNGTCSGLWNDIRRNCLVINFENFEKGIIRFGSDVKTMFLYYAVRLSDNIDLLINEPSIFKRDYFHIIQLDIFNSKEMFISNNKEIINRLSEKIVNVFIIVPIFMMQLQYLCRMFVNNCKIFLGFLYEKKDYIYKFIERKLNL